MSAVRTEGGVDGILTLTIWTEADSLNEFEVLLGLADLLVQRPDVLHELPVLYGGMVPLFRVELSSQLLVLVLDLLFFVADQQPGAERSLELGGVLGDTFSHF